MRQRLVVVSACSRFEAVYQGIATARGVCLWCAYGSISLQPAVEEPRPQRPPKGLDDFLQRQSKALTQMRSWSRCERALLSTPGTASRFNRYDERCRVLRAIEGHTPTASYDS
jgi:hypothetical protein